MMFADDRLRVHYFHDMKKPFYGQFTNTSSAYVPQPDDDKLTVITIKKATTFTQEIGIKLHDELKGLRSSHILFYSAEGSDVELYNGWNFTSGELWDAFYFGHKTSLLFISDTYIVGVQQLQVATVRMFPSKHIYKDRNVTHSLFGVPLR